MGNGSEEGWLGFVIIFGIFGCRVAGGERLQQYKIYHYQNTMQVTLEK